MSEWLQLLTSQGASFKEDIALSFGESSSDYAQLSQATVLCELADQGVLSLNGADSCQFLQGQTTADFDQLDRTTSLNGAFCTLQGRVLSNFTAVLTADDRMLLVMAKGLIEVTLQEKARYAAFFKTELSNTSAQYRILGLSGPDSVSLLAKLYGSVPEDHNSLSLDSGEVIVSLNSSSEHELETGHPAPPRRFIMLIPRDLAAERWQQLEQQARPTGLPYWHLLNIRAGMADIYSETSTAFIPQMLNYDLTDAVSFTKGCYTGQEIVARMQYRGSLKRRLQRLQLKTADLPARGSEITGNHGDKAVGRIVLAAPRDKDHCEALAVLNQAELPSTNTFNLELDGASVCAKLLPLPYTTTNEPRESR